MIVHLAAVVSGEAEADFEKGYAVNFDGTRALFEAIRAQPDYRPRVIFASSIAVYGAPFPEPIPDDFHLTPLTSYGTQKAMSELLLADYSRRGLHRRHRAPAADDLHPAGRAEQGGVGVLLEHPARAAGGQGGGAAGRGRRAALARQPARGGRLLPPRDAARPRARSGRGGAWRCPGCRRRSPSRSRRCAGRPGSAAVRADPPRARPGDPRGSSAAGRPGSTRRGRWRSASSPTPRSTRSSPRTSRTSSADGSLCERGHFRASRCGGKVKRRLADGRHREDDDALVCADGRGAAAGGGRRSGADRGAAAAAGCFGGGAGRGAGGAAGGGGPALRRCARRPRGTGGPLPRTRC